LHGHALYGRSPASVSVRSMILGFT
jgi:hypothetical protein